LAIPTLAGLLVFHRSATGAHTVTPCSSVVYTLYNTVYQTRLRHSLDLYAQ